MAMAVDDHAVARRAHLAPKLDARANATDECRQVPVLVGRVQVARQREPHDHDRHLQKPLQHVHDRNRATNPQEGRLAAERVRYARAAQSMRCCGAMSRPAGR